MGAQIAAHCVNAGVPVVLFDLAAKEGDKNAIVRRAIAQLQKTSPAPLTSNALADHIVPAHYDDDLGLLAGCDMVIQALAEHLVWKRDLYHKLDPMLGPNSLQLGSTPGGER